MQNEKEQILQMIEKGTITASEGMELLEALKDNNNAEYPVNTKLTDRCLRVRVDNAKSKVNVNIPLSLLRVTSKLVNMGMKYIPDEARSEMEKKGIDLTSIDLDELVELIDQGLVDGKLVDVDTEDEESGRTRVEVYVE